MKKLLLFAGVVSLFLTSCADDGWIGYYNSLSEPERLFYDYWSQADKENETFKVYSFANGIRYWVGEKSYWYEFPIVQQK